MRMPLPGSQPGRPLDLDERDRSLELVTLGLAVASVPVVAALVFGWRWLNGSGEGHLLLIAQITALLTIVLTLIGALCEHRRAARARQLRLDILARPLHIGRVTAVHGGSARVTYEYVTPGGETVRATAVVPFAFAHVLSVGGAVPVLVDPDRRERSTVVDAR